MKRYLKGLSLLLAGLSVFVACTDEDGIAKAEWDAEDNYADIYFEGTGESHEFAPTDECKLTLKVFRRDTIGALTVNLEPTINTDSVFKVAPAVFADRDSVAEFDVTFKDAEIGKTYNLQLTSTDPKLVSNWSKGIVYNVDIIRIKWNYIGKGTIWDWWEKQTFGGQTGELDIYQRDDDHNKFRLNNIFEDVAAKAGKTLTGNQTKEAYLTILRKGDVYGGVTVTQANLVGYDDMNTGCVHSDYGGELQYIHPVWFSATHSEDNWSYNRVLGYQENGLPTQIQLAPFYYMDGIGGFNYSQYNDDVIITFPGYEPVYVYEAAFPDDFDWADVKTFDLTNSLTRQSSNVMLQKGTCKVNTDNCDSVFMAKYGVPYVIKNAYAEGYDIVFFVKGKKVYVPEDIWYDLQETGVTEEGLTATPIYAYINEEGSSIEFTEDGDVQSVTLNVSFTDEDGEIVFGEGEQTLANITWTELGTGTYTYTAMFDEPTPDGGLPFSQRDDRETVYKISHWFWDVDFQFAWNKEDNQLVVPAQYTGLSYEGYGDVWVSDVAQFTGNSAYYQNYPCYYDPESKTYIFTPIYYIYQDANTYQWMGDEPETFVLDETGAVKPAKAPLASKLNMNTARKMFNKKKNVWKGLNAQKLDHALGSKFSVKPVWAEFAK